MDRDVLPPRASGPLYYAHFASSTPRIARFTRFPQQRHFVAVVPQGLRALYRQLAGHFGGGLIARLAPDRVFHLFQAQRMRGHAIHRDPDALDLAAGEHGRRGDVDQREIPHLPVADLLEIELRARPGGRDADGRQQVAGLQHRHARDVGGGADEIILGVHHPLALRVANDHLRVERDQRGRGVRRIDGHAAVRAENGVLAVDGGGRIGEADVAAGAIAFPAAAVIPAARVLRHVAADGSLVADLRGGGESRRPRAECCTSRAPADDAPLRSSVVIAPISSPPFASRTPVSSLIWLRSTTTTLGRLMRSFSQSKLSRPPASTQASEPYLASKARASSMVAG